MFTEEDYLADDWDDDDYFDDSDDPFYDAIEREENGFDIDDEDADDEACG